MFAVRTATALHRLLDVLPALSGDERLRPVFTLVPGSAFDAGALVAIERAGARSIPWDEAVEQPFDLIVAASPNGRLHCLKGPLALLPHGAGFNKRAAGGGPDAATGLSRAQVLRADRPLAAFHGLAHPEQLARLATESAQAAARAAVVGDPTLDRLLESAAARARHRAALGTGTRRLVVLTSTWGEQSLLARHPRLPHHLATHLPYDAFQVALVLHPNEHNAPDPFTLRTRLGPALDAGLILAEPYEEWGAVLVAADCVISDHGSTALYAAALDRPVLAAHHTGHDSELLPGSPMAALLAHAPRLRLGPDAPPCADQLTRALAAHRPGAVRELAAHAFAERGRALDLLRHRLYGLLGLTPPPTPPEPRPLPLPAPGRPLTACTVGVTTAPDGDLHVERRPVTGPPGGHLAVEEGLAGTRLTQSAGLLLRRARAGTTGRTGGPETAPPETAAEWSARVLAAYPACRTAGAVLARDHCVLRLRDAPAGDAPHPTGLLSVRITPPHPTPEAPGRYPDPAAVLSAVHTWLLRNPPGTGSRIRCVVADVPVLAELAPATRQEATTEL
nr:translation initiation factor 2 [Streptomyces sp. HNM0574]